MNRQFWSSQLASDKAVVLVFTCLVALSASPKLSWVSLFASVIAASAPKETVPIHEVTLPTDSLVAAGLRKQEQIVTWDDIAEGGITSEVTGQKGTTLELEGWMAFAAPEKVDAIVLTVDDIELAKVEHFYPYRDDHLRFNPPETVLARWRAAVPLLNVHPGQHRLGLKALCADHTAPRLGEHTLTVID